MTGQNTTPPAGPGAVSLRDRAVAAADRADRERAHIEEVTLEQAMERVADLAAGVAVQVLGAVAQGARWTALDAEGAVAEIGGERFRFRLGHDAALDPHVLYHAIACEVCGGFALAEIGGLSDLGTLLRDQPEGTYRCETCTKARDTRAPGRAATAGLPPLPTRGEALRRAVRFAERAGDQDDADWPERTAAYAALSQAWSALARAIGRSRRTDEAGD